MEVSNLTILAFKIYEFQAISCIMKIIFAC